MPIIPEKRKKELNIPKIFIKRLKQFKRKIKRKWYIY